jgi:hypothetical protein
MSDLWDFIQDYYNIKVLVWYEKHDQPLKRQTRESWLKNGREYQGNLYGDYESRWIDLAKVGFFDGL